MKKSTILRKILKERRAIPAPGAHDVISAKLIERAGFEIIRTEEFTDQTPASIAERVRNRLGLVFSTTPGIDRGASLATGDRAVVEIDGRRISLALTPFDTTPDARVETAPRRRGLIGGSVTREELVLDGPADRVIGELRGAVVRGRVV